MSAGSYVRFAIGILLSLSVLASFLGGGTTSALSALLSVLFIALAVMWILIRF